jgi:hypothetical protein
VIERPTVLVLGAGASRDFGFPLAWDLKRRVYSQFASGTGGMTEHLLKLGISAAESTGFARELVHSTTMSVDTFLEGRPDLVRVGKLAIAAVLIACERPEEIHVSRESPTWLDYLTERLSARREDWDKNQLSIVTFNYDRLVEYYLHLSFMSRFGCSRDEAAALVQRTVKIVHLHGQLGLYPWETASLSPDSRVWVAGHRKFEVDLSSMAISTAADAIRVVHEGSDTDDVFSEAHALLEAADEVVFMGFSYGRDNMRRLAGVDGQRLAGKTVRGSAIGMEEREQQRAHNLAPDCLTLWPTDNLVTFMRRHPVFGH